MCVMDSIGYSAPVGRDWTSADADATAAAIEGGTPSRCPPFSADQSDDREEDKRKEEGLLKDLIKRWNLSLLPTSILAWGQAT
jgi:hypothetical protein